MNKKTYKITWPFIFVVIVIALVALGFGFQFGISRDKEQNSIQNLVTATVLTKPRSITSFKLTDNHQQIFNNQTLKGHWTFLFFGFTNCPHICPTTMMDMKQVYKILAKNQIKEPQFMLITIDPNRDQPKVLNTFVTAFNKNFMGATGTQEQIDHLAKALNVVYMKAKPKSDKDAVEYDIDHSGTIMLVNPNGELMAFFTMPHNPETIAKDFEMIQKKYG